MLITNTAAAMVGGLRRTWGGDDEIASALKVLELGAHVESTATVDDNTTNAGPVGELSRLVEYL